MAISQLFANGGAIALFSDRHDGDARREFAGEAYLPRTSRLWSSFSREIQRYGETASNLEFVRLSQTHSSTTQNVSEFDEVFPREGDALISNRYDMAPVMLTADCIPIALYARDIHAVCAVHAGWRGLVGGVVQSAVRQLRSLGAVDIASIVGPHICVRCYEFLGPSRSEVQEVFGDAYFDGDNLDLALLCRRICQESEVRIDAELSICTAESPEFPSARKEGAQDRLALACVLLG